VLVLDGAFLADLGVLGLLGVLVEEEEEVLVSSISSLATGLSRTGFTVSSVASPSSLNTFLVVVVDDGVGVVVVDADGRRVGVFFVATSSSGASSSLSVLGVTTCFAGVFVEVVVVVEGLVISTSSLFSFVACLVLGGRGVSL
jgi:hypothetical protein